MPKQNDNANSNGILKNNKLPWPFPKSNHKEEEEFPPIKDKDGKLPWPFPTGTRPK